MLEMVIGSQNGKTSLPCFSIFPLKRIGNFVAAGLYFFAAHIYDGLCYAVSSIVSYPMALFMMTALLFSASVALVLLHEVLRERFQWDILGMHEINRLTMTSGIPKHHFFKRLMRWALNRGRWWILLIGSFTVGPPVVTLLLAKENWKSRLSYLASGTLISVLIWVTIWAGVGELTWNQYVIPLIETLRWAE